MHYAVKLSRVLSLFNIQEPLSIKPGLKLIAFLTFQHLKIPLGLPSLICATTLKAEHGKCFDG